MTPDRQQPSLFYLPYDVRVKIYTYALTSDQPITVSSAWHGSAGLSPSLLRTNRQLHDETSPILYKENEFFVDDARRCLHWLVQIGAQNVGNIKHVRIFVDAIYDDASALLPYLGPVSTVFPKESELWYRLLSTLARDATGLRFMHVYWDSKGSYVGAGADVRFVQELAMIQSLDEMVIDGYFAKPWPEYLQQKLGRPVWNEQGQSQSYLMKLANFQRCTETLTP